MTGPARAFSNAPDVLGDVLRKPVRSILTLVGGGFVAGIVFWGGFNTAMEATNTKEFCISCHEMRTTVFEEYRTTIHAANRTGVSAPFRLPRAEGLDHKILRKIQASQEVWGKITGRISTPEKFDAKRLAPARHEWERMKLDSRECRNCHTFEGMNPENQRPRARKQHPAAMEAGNTCIDCHKGIVDTNVRLRLTGRRDRGVGEAGRRLRPPGAGVGDLSRRPRPRRSEGGRRRRGEEGRDRRRRRCARRRSHRRLPGRGRQGRL